jgi:hypothetical protein
MRTTPMPFLEASHSNTKILLKSRKARIGVVHITNFKAWTEWYVVGVQLKAIFLRSFVRGVVIMT